MPIRGGSAPTGAGFPIARRPVRRALERARYVADGPAIELTPAGGSTSEVFQAAGPSSEPGSGGPPSSARGPPLHLQSCCTRRSEMPEQLRAITPKRAGGLQLEAKTSGRQDGHGTFCRRWQAVGDRLAAASVIAIHLLRANPLCFLLSRPATLRHFARPCKRVRREKTSPPRRTPSRDPNRARKWKSGTVHPCLAPFARPL